MSTLRAVLGATKQSVAKAFTPRILTSYMKVKEIPLKNYLLQKVKKLIGLKGPTAGTINSFFARLAYGTVLDRSWRKNNFALASSLGDMYEYFRGRELVTFAVHLKLLMIFLSIFCGEKNHIAL